MSTKEQVENAVKWIDGLPSLPQAPKGQRGELGNMEDGFCCLGAGCYLTDTPYDPTGLVSESFAERVGLSSNNGDLQSFSFYGWDTLGEVNDYTNAGFKRISHLLRNKPEWMFTPKVAKGIREHYEKTN